MQFQIMLTCSIYHAEQEQLLTHFRLMVVRDHNTRRMDRNIL